MKVIKPERLRKGDLIGIISPASTPDDLNRIEQGRNYLEKLGYQTEIGANVGKNRGYLAGTDEQRVSDLHYMFSNKKVKAVFCVRGGYGSPRLLDKINFQLIRKNPKIFVGYSDITVLQMAILKKAGLVTFAGPMVAVDFARDEINQFTNEFFWRLLTSPKKIGSVGMPGEEKLFTINPGKANGTITGGNLALLVSLAGTQYFPDLKGNILFLEDIGEQPYRIDRMLNHLKLMGAFKFLKGVILGAFTDCVETDLSKRTLSLNEVIEDYFRNMKLPVMYNFPHGHIQEMVTIPFGINIKMNTVKGTIEYSEGAVS